MLHLNNHKFYVRDSFQDLRTREQHAIAPLRSMRGYSYRIHPTIGKVLLNISPANSAFWRPFLVHEVLRNGNGSFGGLIEGGQRALKNIRVYITYDRDNKDGRCKNPKFKDAVCGTGTSKSKM
ncbi:repeatdomain containing protein, partial [Pyrenophora tritici-repentis]